MLPRLIDSKKCAEPDITEDSAILYFSLEEKFPIGCVMDMLDDDMDLLLLYHGISKTAPNIHHCCFFASPKLGQSMYKVNMVSQPNGFIDGITVTIYDSIDVWEDEFVPIVTPCGVCDAFEFRAVSLKDSSSASTSHF